MQTRIPCVIFAHRSVSRCFGLRALSSRRPEIRPDVLAAVAATARTQGFSTLASQPTDRALSASAPPSRQPFSTAARAAGLFFPHRVLDRRRLRWPSSARQ